MIEKYGKEYGDIGKIKENFLTENEKLLKEWDLRGDIYRKQPLRINCKLCDHPLDNGKGQSFVSHNITYYICPYCQHVNGIYEETPEFSEFVYCEQDYGREYSEKSRMEYQNRKKLIYSPKVQFLKEVIPEKRSILEIGSGSGYFCLAASDEGYDIEGVEISKKQVEFANKMIGRTLSAHVPANQMADYVRNTDREIIVAIGVLEHIHNLRQILMAIKENRNIRYLYFSVPLFSFSVFFEMMFQDCFNRQLGGDHTHLFTIASIEYMNQEFGFEIEGKWVFGTDIFDLYRFMQIRLIQDNSSVLEIFQNSVSGSLDSLQKVVDEYEFASEIHIVVKVLH